MKKSRRRKAKRNSISAKEDDETNLVEDQHASLVANEKLNSTPNHKHKRKHKHKKRKLTKEESNTIKAEKYIEKMKEFMEKKKKAKTELRKQKILKACKTGFGIALVAVEIILLCL